MIWSFPLEETGHRTVILTQRRDAPEGVSDLSRDLIESRMGEQDAFTETMRAGTRATLEDIRAAVLTESKP